MSHVEQLGFVTLCRDNLCSARSRVIEIGSLQVSVELNSIRDIFADTPEYIGVDLTDGPGVDLIASGHEITEPDASFDVAISSECFEHNPYWAKTFTNMHRMIKCGGVVIMTCATTGRVEHGTTRTDPAFSPGTSSLGWDYYRNLTQADFERALPIADMFNSYAFYVGRTSHDLYFWGVKAPRRISQATIKTISDSVRRLGDLRQQQQAAHQRFARTVARAPLGVLSRVLPERTFQNIAVPYQRAVTRVGATFGIRQ